MLVTLDGITTEVKPEQPENAYDPMLVTLDGITTEVKAEQLENANAPMLVTLEGITIEVKVVSLNAYAPMLVTLEGIEELLHPYTKVFVAVSMMALHPSRLSYLGLPSSTTMVVRLACCK